MKFLILALALSQTALAGVYGPNQWRTNEVVVCFAKGEFENRIVGDYVLKVRDWDEKHKRKVQKWVNEEYTPARTGIYFTGWKTCEETPEADVPVFYNKNKGKILSFFLGGLHGLAGLGPTKGSVAGYPKAGSFASISSSGVDKGTVLHEFGHVAGLGHEHTHPDADKNGKACSVVEPSFSYYYEYEPYDVESIMSYCSVNNNRLSEGDVALLKKLYP